MAHGAVPHQPIVDPGPFPPFSVSPCLRGEPFVFHLSSRFCSFSFSPSQSSVGLRSPSAQGNAARVSHLSCVRTSTPLPPNPVQPAAPLERAGAPPDTVEPYRPWLTLLVALLLIPPAAYWGVYGYTVVQAIHWSQTA